MKNKGNVLNNEVRSRNHYRRVKARSVIYSECMFVGLVVEHAKRTLLIMLSSVTCPALPYFSTLSLK